MFMPTVNMYYRNSGHEAALAEVMEPLKELVAGQLSCGDRLLAANEVTIRDIKTIGAGMLADVELDITAAPYDERVQRQDAICLQIQSFMKSRIPDANDVLVWLNLHELGHSFVEDAATE